MSKRDKTMPSAHINIVSASGEIAYRRRNMRLCKMFSFVNRRLPFVPLLIVLLTLLVMSLTTNDKARNLQTRISIPFETPNLSNHLIPCVLSAVVPDTASQRALKRLRRKEHKHSRSISQATFAESLTVHSSASPSTLTTHDVHVNENTQSSTFAHSADEQSTVLCHVSASELPVEDSFLLCTLDDSRDSSHSAPPHVYLDHLQHVPSPYDNDFDYSYINTPYSADGFDSLLERTNLTQRFPELTYKLRNGFSIGHNLTPLSSTYTPNNLPGAEMYKELCDEYVAEELNKGRFSGPFTHQELFAKIGHFRSSPLQVVVKKGVDGAPDKHRVCRHLSYAGSMSHSVNDEIDAADYPTEWGNASEFADIVRHILYFCVRTHFAMILRVVSHTRNSSFEGTHTYIHARRLTHPASITIHTSSPSIRRFAPLLLALNLQL